MSTGKTPVSITDKAASKLREIAAAEGRQVVSLR